MKELPLIWGMENEAGGRELPYTTHGGHVKAFSEKAYLLNLNIKCGTDASAVFSLPERMGDKGFEFRTFSPWREFPEKEVKFMIDYMRDNNITPTRRSGLHFHFSGFKLSRVQYSLIHAALLNTKWWKGRRNWIKNDGHHSALAVVESIPSFNSHISQGWELNTDSHYEARVFNASNDYHGILQPWLFLKRLVHKVVNENP